MAKANFRYIAVELVGKGSGCLARRNDYGSLLDTGCEPLLGFLSIFCV